MRINDVPAGGIFRYDRRYFIKLADQIALRRTADWNGIDLATGYGGYFSERAVLEPLNAKFVRTDQDTLVSFRDVPLGSTIFDPDLQDVLYLKVESFASNGNLKTSVVSLNSGQLQTAIGGPWLMDSHKLVIQ